ncbi:MAG: redox-regulated ATPase YchF [Parcubacteria group bacterium]|nr:redox-regulated ATPase YchF [Parcubacteria group bacterium]
MKLSIGIVGLPNVGKSTLFKILTKQEVHIANYPFATIDPNVGVVSVPDERLQALAELHRSKKIIPAIVEFYDIAGLVKGAAGGEGLGNQFLSHIREVEIIIEVVRVFASEEIIHVENKIDPIKDIEAINTELILKDIETVQKRLEKLEKEAKTGDKSKIKDWETMKKTLDGLNKNILARNIGQELLDEPSVKELNLLTAKPQIYLFNGKEEEVNADLKNKISAFGGKSLDADYLIADLSKETSVSNLIRKAYEILGLISFFTTGEDETRAWAIKKGQKAPQAAGVIHSDFEKKFIRAEIISSDKLLEAGDWQRAKQKGLIRLEGKDYVMRDGDVMIVRHG